MGCAGCADRGSGCCVEVCAGLVFGCRAAVCCASVGVAVVVPAGLLVGKLAVPMWSVLDDAAELDAG